MLPSISFLVCCIGLVIFKVEGSVVGQEAWVEWSAYKVQTLQVLWCGRAHLVCHSMSVWSISGHPSGPPQHIHLVCRSTGILLILQTYWLLCLPPSLSRLTGVSQYFKLGGGILKTPSSG